MIRLLAVMAAMFGALAVSAKDYVLVEGVNELEAYTNAYGVYTAEKDGKVLVETQDYVTVTCGGKNIDYTHVAGSGYPYHYEISDVKAGDEITLSSGFLMMSSVRITTYSGIIPVEVLNLVPHVGEVFSWSSSGNVSVNFNKAVTIKSVKLVAGSYSANVDDVHVGTGLGFNVTNALNEALKGGYIKPGDRFSVEVTGLCDLSDPNNLFNEDGKLTLRYIAPNPQYDFVKATVGDYQLSYTQANSYDFLSYYPVDGEDGLIVVEFDGDVKSVGSVFMSMGNIDLDASGKYHRSSMPYTIEGNKLLIDARGKLRTLAVLFPAVYEEEAGEGTEVNEGIGTYDTEHLTITVSNVVDVNGNVFRTNLQGSVGSFSFVMNYKEIIDEAFIDGDNKADGDEVKSAEEVSLWLSNPDIKFDAIEVSYFISVPDLNDATLSTQEQRVELVKDFGAEPDAVEGAIITFNMPNIVDAIPGSTVRVALHNASSADGMPHYLYIEFKAEGVADAIESVVNKKADGTIYNLNGVKVSETNAHNGLFIVGGKTKFIR